MNEAMLRLAAGKIASDLGRLTPEVQMRLLTLLTAMVLENQPAPCRATRAGCLSDGIRDAYVIGSAQGSA